MAKTLKWPIIDSAKPINLGLERVMQALKKLGDPHLQLPPVIHFAGTNGKGSTIAFLRAILEAAGKKCHVYTSPHLVDFNERIVLAGKQISDEYLAEILEETESKCGDMGLTFFEGTTVAAFLAFSKVKADYLLLETGLGGRLDATNVIDKPMMTVITPISYDHMEFLGDTIEKITAEKAAIMKEGVPCIISNQSTAALEVVKAVAAEKNVELNILDEEFSYQINNDGNFIYRDDAGGTGFPKPPLRGRHQYDNAATAVRVAIRMGVDKKHVKAGIKETKWNARMQKIGPNIFLDGGHNPDAAAIIRDFVLTENTKNKRHNIAIIGMLKTKDSDSFIENMKGVFGEIYAVTIPNSNDALEASDIKKLCSANGIKCTAFDNFNDAYTTACNGKTAENNRVVICGSLYLAGHVLEELKLN